MERHIEGTYPTKVVRKRKPEIQTHHTAIPLYNCNGLPFREFNNNNNNNIQSLYSAYYNVSKRFTILRTR